MACYHPLTGYYSKVVNASGKRSIVFNPKDALDSSRPIHLPCQRCIGCRLERSKQWATRCILEKELHKESMFITLTYAPEYLKSDSLIKKDLQDYIKRLRRKIEYYKPDTKIRFFACGEYGENFSRPHFHCIIYGFWPCDAKVHSTDRLGNTLYISEFMQSCWPYGWCPFGTVTFESAAYVARYITKKVTGEPAEEHYHGRVPEFLTMSLKPGIGAEWLSRYRDDVYPHDYIVIRGGVKVKPPKYFDSLLERENPDLLAEIKENRKIKSVEQVVHALHQRDIKLPAADAASHYSYDERCFMLYEDAVLPVLEEVKQAKSKRLKRGYECEA